MALNAVSSLAGNFPLLPLSHKYLLRDSYRPGALPSPACPAVNKTDGGKADMTSSLPTGPRFPLGPHRTRWPTPKVALQRAEDSGGFPQVSRRLNTCGFFTYSSNRVNIYIYFFLNIYFMDQTSTVLGVRLGASNNDTETTGLTRHVPG